LSNPASISSNTAGEAGTVTDANGNPTATATLGDNNVIAKNGPEEKVEQQDFASNELLEMMASIRKVSFAPPKPKVKLSDFSSAERKLNVHHDKPVGTAELNDVTRYWCSTINEKQLNLDVSRGIQVKSADTAYIML